MPFVTVMLEKFDVAWKRMPPFGCPNEFHGALNVNENVFPPSSSGLRMGMLPGLMPRHDCVALPKFHTSPVAEQVAGTGVAVGLAWASARASAARMGTGWTARSLRLPLPSASRSAMMWERSLPWATASAMASRLLDKTKRAPDAPA